jgi:hypothetical protein
VTGRIRPPIRRIARRAAKRATIVIAAACVTGPALAQSDRHTWSFDLDVHAAFPSTDASTWLDGGLGKLRYDESDDPLGLGRIAFEYDGRLAPTWRARLVGDVVEDGSNGLGVTEAYVEWRPIPHSANRQRLKVGAFYPPLSLENTDSGWKSPYTISSSAIDTWLAEEVRTIGAQWSLQRPLGGNRSPREITTFAAFFYGNDPAGTLLAWKGWGLHDRQTRLGDVLPLPPLPQIVPGGAFRRQLVRAEPFIEIDHRPGFYAGAEIRFARRALVAAMHYDNHADPMSARNGQYGWDTRFDHVGVQFELPADMGLIAQWMDGVTMMGPKIAGARAVDDAFESYFVLLTKRFDRHRVSLRWDDFSVTDNDVVPLDDNNEYGYAWTVGYSYEHSARFGVRVEWMEVESDRPANGYLGLPDEHDEQLLQMQFNVRLGSRLHRD